MPSLIDDEDLFLNAITFNAIIELEDKLFVAILQSLVEAEALLYTFLAIFIRYFTQCFMYSSTILKERQSLCRFGVTKFPLSEANNVAELLRKQCPV